MKQSQSIKIDTFFSDFVSFLRLCFGKTSGKIYANRGTERRVHTAGGTNRERKETAKVKERNLNDEVPISEMAELLGVEENTIYKKVGKLKDEFKVENKIVKRREPQENQGPESDVEVNLTPPKKAGSKTRKTNHRKTQKNQGFERKKNG